ncbi:uncharacterized protein LOC127905168 isoform X4 [Populus trichocarpa]|uniref:uncharacterized protein LOC127905168 isoform X4 n=1 Tax=Populus trichocarpa TaxID=3694 RepID=UPI0022783005|nr:uncharacterized protein LOC127905168 isoform X4 [Populus trichocarpa]
MIGLDFSKQLAALQTVRGGVSNSEGWEILGIDYSRLLNELDNRYPGVYLSGKEASRPLVVAEVLSSSAFILASSRESGAGGTSISRPLNSLHLGDLNSLLSYCRNHELDPSKGVLAPSELFSY